MVDVHLPTTDGRTLILSRHTEPDPEQQLLLERLRLQLPRNPHQGSPPPWKPASTKRLVVPTLAAAVTAKQGVTQKWRE
ncbi:hypothetical protein LDC_1727 [sediment metagenome]|uniref:Transposase n=1 Tax=sediment metagenome TaxID=749907 RepID=D9PJL6_9ZZZZ